MKMLKQAWHYFLWEPLTWIIYCFFQPGRFAREFAMTDSPFWKRIIPMLRLFLPMFLCSYPLVLLTHITLYKLFPTLAPYWSGDLLRLLAEEAVGIAGGIAGGLAGGLAFPISYAIGYFRLPLYIISGPSGFKAYITSQNNPPQVFTYLHHSALHWDERVYLPLPYLKRTLRIAAEQNIEQTLEEIAFIVKERPQQRKAARAISSEIAVRDLEAHRTMPEIATASHALTSYFRQTRV